MVSGFGNGPFFPKPIVFIFGDPKITQIIQKKSQIVFKPIISESFIFWKFHNLEMFGRDGRRTIPSIRLINLESLAGEIKIKSMKYMFGNLGSLKL